MRAKFVNENISFERGQDPKSAMGIGEWAHGYRIDKYPDFDDWDQGANDLLVWQDWNWSKNTFAEGLIRKTEVTPAQEPQLDPLPVVTFKNYDKFLNGFHEGFPFSSIPFIANVEDAEGHSYLISAEGYDYPRYITELV